MKRFAVVLAGLLVLPAFAEVAPSYLYEEEVAFDETEIDPVVEEETTPAPQKSASSVAATPRSATGRVPASRSMPVTSVSGNTANSSASGRSLAARGVTGRSSGNTNTNVSTARSVTGVATRGTAARGTATRTTVSRAGQGATGAAASSVARSGAATGTVTQGLTTRSATNTGNNSAVTARASSVVQTDTVNKSLYIGRGTSARASMVAPTRTSTVRVSSGGNLSAVTDVTPVSTTDMDELAQLTDFCKAQYTQCMDNFCNVLDDNQGRCSCSANLKNYEKTETALKTATEELQDVAQKIQYIGLTADEITTLFTQTEAELKMQNTTDNSQLKTDLDKIKRMIVDVQGGKASTTTDSGISMDLSNLLDFTIDSTGFDLSALFGVSNGNTSSISNQRGEQLYKTATARCKAAVLNTCSAQGVDTTIITNSYDLEIDKQCIAYERALTDSNEQMISTVRNAKSVLQKARLLVEQQKNQYDMRGCINALDSCMQDEFVCGTDYEGCLDPTGKYIVNGELVIGSTPGMPGVVDGTNLSSVWKYSNNNAWGTGDAGSLGGFVESEMSSSTSSLKNVATMGQFLRRKIGYIDSDGKVQGMCASVLARCQDYTFTKNGTKKTYNDSNDVVRGYLERVLVQIKAQQDQVLSDYAETCVSDVYSCLQSNSSVSNYYSENLTSGNFSAVAKNACKSYITTCMSVTGSYTYDDADKWLNDVMGVTAEAMSKCRLSGGDYDTSAEQPCTCSSTKGLTESADKTYCVCSDTSKTYDFASGECK